MPASERDWMKYAAEREVPPFEHPFEPEPPPEPPSRWARWAFAISLAVGGVALVYPPILGVVLALWLIVYLLEALVRSLHP